MNRTLFLASVLALFAMVPGSASAYWPYVGYGGFGGYGGYDNYGYGWGYNQATSYVHRPLPYYAMYPPVYYSSHITARHYGASPFAWSGGMQPITYAAQPAMAAAPEPVVIENPYVTSSKSTNKQVSAAEPAIQPLKIDNPFVVSVSR